LEQRVLERTKEIQMRTEQLKKYAYANSHHVRGPLARIMGLIQIIKTEEGNGVNEQYLNYLSQACDEMDAIIRNISETLHTEFSDID
jgi:signal transduction histidine kinase